jgi:hypothetical protein
MPRVQNQPRATGLRSRGKRGVGRNRTLSALVSIQEQRPHEADSSAALRASADVSYTMNITGTVGSGLSRTRFLDALEPGIIGRWHSGQYSLYRVNHSSKQREWKA